MIRSTRIRFAASLLALATLAACDGSPAGPETGLSMDQLAGTYSASGAYGAFELTTVEDGETIDWLAAGATVELRLAADGTTAGALSVPGADEDGSDLRADLDGRWTLSGDTVHFEHDADTFIRDMPFAAVGSTLVGDRRFDDVRVRMVLQRD